MDARTPHPKLLQFESHTALGPTFAARLLGIPYISYAQYRSSTRPLKKQLVFHMEALMLLDAEVLRKRISEVVYGTHE